MISQYKNPEFRFIILGKKSKLPVEKKWTTENNYRYDDLKLNLRIKQGYNYGIMGGYGNLLVIDFDNRLFQNIIIEQLPETFTVKTAGKGLYHLYYIVDKPFRKFAIRDKNDNTLADFQCIGGQVVACGSRMDNGKEYIVVNDIPIVDITVETLMSVFGPLSNFHIQKKPTQKLNFTPKFMSKEIIEKISITDMLEQIGVDTSKNPTKCPFHDMKGKGNFSYDDNLGLWHCFHCNRGGTVIHLWAYYRNISYFEAIKELYNIVSMPEDEKYEIK